MRVWQVFKDTVVACAPAEPDGVAAAVQQLRLSLSKLDGVCLPPEVCPAIQYSGTPRDGFCDAVCTVAGGTVPLYQRLHFEEQLPGLVNALFFAAALPLKWSRAHGCYDRDIELILSKDRLIAELMSADLTQPISDLAWPPAGVRVVALMDGFEVACLASRPGRGIYDVALTIRHGEAGALVVRDVYVWGQGILY